MHRTYLNKKVHLIFITLIILLAFFSLKKIALLTLVIYGVLSYLLRKSDTEYFKEMEPSGGVIMSPVHGQIVSIKKGVSHKEFGENLWEIRFIIPLGEKSGLYLPHESEVTNLVYKRGESFFRYSKKDIPVQGKVVLDGPILTLQNKNDGQIGLQFLECPIGLYPRFFVLPGDKGQAKANFGYFPLGGTVLLYLPENYEILVNENANVSPGERLIASIKN
jgi:hypothetical protein